MWVALVVIDVLFKVELRLVAVGWQEWVSLMVMGMLCSSRLGVVVVGSHWW